MIAIAPPGHRPCTTTSISWFLGQDADPAIKEPLRQIEAWVDMRNQLVVGSAMDKQRWISIQRSFFTLLTCPKLRKSGWSKVTGPIAATIMTLRRIGWRAESTAKWLAPNTDNEGNRMRAVFCDEQGGPSTLDQKQQLMDAIRKDLVNQDWEKASKHYLGGGAPAWHSSHGTS